MSYPILQVFPSDTRMIRETEELLRQEGIQRDANLDYTCVMTDDDGRPIATGSCFHDTLRCFAVDHRHQGEGLLNEIISHLIEVESARGYLHLFLYTKPAAARFFSDLGFCEIARVPGRLVFMENRRDGFPAYLRALSGFRSEEESAAVVMNANPFTLGHRYLLEKASAACKRLHLFVVSEDASLVPAQVRRRLVEAGTADLPNVVIHDCGPYIISSATFPSYFPKDEETVIESQARLDISVFAKIAKTLNVTTRFVGEEPMSQVTGIYNRIMREALPENGVRVVVIPRAEAGGKPISASTARLCLKNGDWETLGTLLPETTLAYFRSEEAAPVLARIRGAGDVVHY